MSLKHAILGFLSFQSLSGYDLKKAFDHSVQHFWPANQSQIYRTLAALKQEGLVTQEVIEREDRLDKKLYHITDEGRVELHQWLSTPLPPDDFRMPFLIQIYFGGKLTDEELLGLMNNEIRVVSERLAVFREMYHMYQGQIDTAKEPRAFFLSVLTLEVGMVSDQVFLEWLESVAQRVSVGNYQLKEI